MLGSGQPAFLELESFLKRKAFGYTVGFEAILHFCLMTLDKLFSFLALHLDKIISYQFVI